MLPEKLYPILRSPDTWNAVGAGLGCWHGTKIWQNFGADMNDNRMIMAIESAQHQATNSIFVVKSSCLFDGTTILQFSCQISQNPLYAIVAKGILI